MAASIPPIDTSFGQDSIDTTTTPGSTPTSPYKSSVIPAHSSLPSPLSPPLSVSPSRGSMSMATLALASPPSSSSPSPSSPSPSSPRQHITTTATTATITTSPHPPVTTSGPSLSPSLSSLPPLHPSENHSTTTTTDLSHPHLSRVGLAASTLPLIQTSPEQWLQHAAQQRRHVSTGSLSSATSYTSHFSSQPSPSVVSQSPIRLAFSESEQPHDMSISNKESASASVLASASASACVSDDDEPTFDMNVRPSVLRASLMARAQRSSKKKRSESMPFDQASRLSMQSNMSSISSRSFSSTFDSRPSARSSTSSIGNWAPRARSSSVSSQGSTGSVNLDAIIASESDLNEEKPLELVEGDEVDWTSKEERARPVVQNAQSSLPTLPLMANSYSTPRTHFEDQVDEYWTGSVSEDEIGDDEDDEEFGEALREFSQMSLKTSSGVQVRGLGFSSGLPSSSRISAGFTTKKNPFDLDADYMVSPSGFGDLRSGSRTSTYSNPGTASNRSSISKMPTPSGLVQPKSGLKAPGASRLAQPGARSLVQPKPTASRGNTSVGPAPRSGLQTPRGLQAPRTGLQAPKTVQAPRTGSTTTRAPTKPGLALPRTGPSSSLAKPQVRPGSRLAPPPAPASRVNTTRSLAPPATIKRPNIPTSTSNRTSLLQAPASMASRSNGTVGATVARMNAASQSFSKPGLTSPTRSQTMPSGLVSPTRIRTGGSAMVSPTSSQSSTSSVPSLGYGARDSSQRLMNATGTNASSTKSRLMGPRIATGRTSMYGSSAHLRMEEDYEDDTYYEDYHPDYAVLTPPQSPSAKGSRLSMVPTRLAIPTTSRIGRPSSPSVGVTGLRGPQVHGLVSPKAGRY